MANAKKELVWQPVDVASITGTTKKALDEYHAANKVAQGKRVTFEKEFLKLAKGRIPEGKELRFGYRWGKLAVALDDARKSGGSTEAFTL